MKTTEHSPARLGFIVLDKADTGEEFLKVVEVVAFFKISSVIGIDGWLNEEDVGDGLRRDFEFHTIKFLSQLKFNNGMLKRFETQITLFRVPFDSLRSLRMNSGREISQ